MRSPRRSLEACLLDGFTTVGFIAIGFTAIGFLLTGCTPATPDFGQCNRDSDCILGHQCVARACVAEHDAELDLGAARDAAAPVDFGPLLACDAPAVPAAEQRVECGQACELPGFVPVPAGDFMMGSPDGEQYRPTGQAEDREPLHPVSLTRDIWMKATEVTRAEWDSLLARMPAETGPLLPLPCEGEDCPAGCRAADCPASQVSWFEALAWANALSIAENLPPCYVLEECRQAREDELAGMVCDTVSINAVGRNPMNCLGYRLPTEAEWEYAARAGTQSAWYSGDDEEAVGEIAWFDQNAEGRAHPVGLKRPNAWGLYDMAGNLPEWVWDGDTALRSTPATDPIGLSGIASKVFRGGAFYMNSGRARSAARGSALPVHQQRNGFRVARTMTICGDAVCAPNETAATCPADCPVEGFAIVPQGVGVRGSLDGEPGREAPAAGDPLPEPRFDIRLLRSVWAKATEVTHEEWQALMAPEAAEPECARCPKTQITWFDALRWCNARSRAEALPECYLLTDCEPGIGCAVTVNAPDGDPHACLGYRLPTETEWEYMARAGETARWYDAANDPGGIAWYADNAERAMPVGSKTGNCWGLYDTAGNVHEWVWDDSNGAGRPSILIPDFVTAPTDTGKRVVRGGAYTTTAAQTRAAARMEWAPTVAAEDIGFRPVRTIHAPVTTPAWSVGHRGPAGGWVFYDKGVRTNGWRYLEMAAVDQSPRTTWGCTDAEMSDFYHWIGGGVRNTARILAGCAERPIAASIADSSDEGGVDDWFLPTLQAWRVIQTALIERGLGDLRAQAFYWAATISLPREFGWIWRLDLFENAAWCRDCPARVRAIRRF